MKVWSRNFNMFKRNWQKARLCHPEDWGVFSSKQSKGSISQIRIDGKIAVGHSLDDHFLSRCKTMWTQQTSGDPPTCRFQRKERHDDSKCADRNFCTPKSRMVWPKFDDERSCWIFYEARKPSALSGRKKTGQFLRGDSIKSGMLKELRRCFLIRVN